MKATDDMIRQYLPMGKGKQFLLLFPCIRKEGPVVLFIHDGPGLGCSLMSHVFQGDLQNTCTMVYWDMPGAGKSLGENPDYFPSMDSIQKDLLILVNCLKIKYQKGKIVLLGHGFGAIAASLYALHHPMDIACCIEASPMIGGMDSEKAAAAALMEAIRTAGKPADEKKLSSLSPYPSHDMKEFQHSLLDFRKLQKKYGIWPGKSGLASLMVKSPLFSFSDLQLLKNGLKKNIPLWEYLLGYSQLQEIKGYKMPVWMILGEKDAMTPTAQSLNLLERIKAPQKERILLPNAGHFLMLEQPEAFRSALRTILSSDSF